MSATHIVWVDCEMTGLSLVHDALIELAVLITDDELNVLGDGVDVVIKPPDAALEQMDDFVRNMHTKSALLDELAAGITLAEAEQQALDYIHQYVTEPRKAPMAGNSIATDRNFISRDMTTLDNFLHYRMIDVSSVKELSRRWYPRAYFQAPAKQGGHRALADISESINELAYYRAAVFVPPPGPDSATAKAIAATFSGVSESTPASPSA